MDEMRCPRCGHTCPDHSGESGCVQCACTMGWVDVICVNVNLQFA
jgi:hypothetical protein